MPATDDDDFAVGRDAMSRRRLTLKWGSALRAWAAARRAAWRVDRQWTPERMMGHIETFRAGTFWPLLEDASTELETIDRWACRFAGCRWWLEAAPVVYPRYRTQDLWRRLRADLPDLKHARLRYLLARETRRGHLLRLARGQYEAPPARWRYIDDDEREFREWQDAAAARWMARFAQQQVRRANVLFLHYLLPNLPTYRKLRVLQVSERTYYYELAHALDEFDRDIRWMTRQRNVQ